MRYNDAGSYAVIETGDGSAWRSLALNPTSGNVGIGTTIPDAKLTVQKDNTDIGVGQILVWGATDNNKRLSIGLQTTGNYGYIQSYISGSGYWPTFINPDGGNVGIGTKTASEKLEVNGNIKTTGGAAFGATAIADNVNGRVNGFTISGNGYMNARTSDQWAIGLAANSGPLLEFFSDNGSTSVFAGSIAVNGATSSYNTSSDRRLKTNIRDYKLSGPIIDRLKPRIFDWKSGDKDGVGFIAQELYEVYPAAVTKGDDDAKKIQKTWAVDYSKLVPVLVAEIQALRERVAELEKKKP
jgi:hypothetical protein